MKLRWSNLLACALLVLPLLVTAGCNPEPPADPTPAPLKPGEKGASTGTLLPGKTGAAGAGPAAPAGN